MHRKRVLFITYYWPPAGGIGVLRCLKIVKYIREFGWEPVVYTVKDAQYPAFDYSLLEQVPEGLEVLKQSAIEPFNIYKMLTGKKKKDPLINVLTSNTGKTGVLHDLSVWIRSNFFIPDARSLWIRPSVKYLLKYLEKHPVDAIFTDGPPHTNTMIACLVKEKTGIPWLSDFQDPWTQVDYYELLKLTTWADKKHRAMEQRVFRTADRMTIVSDTWKKDLESIGAKNVSVIPWGFDPDDFPEESVIPDTKFSISHIGLLGNDRNPDLFFKALAELKDEIPGFSDQTVVKLVGAVDVSVKQSAEKYGMADCLVLINQVSRKEALQLMRQSALLLLLLNKADNAMGRIPGKLFEYLACKRPVLCLGPSGSDVHNILTEVNGGISVEYDAVPELKSEIKRFYLKWKEGNLVSESKGLEKYSIKNLSGQVAGLLNQIVKR